MLQKILACVIKYIPTNLASIFGILQALIKLLKEVITAVINILYPLFGDNFDLVVYKARDLINKLDEGCQKIKSFLLKIGISS